MRGLNARPLDIAGYGDEDEELSSSQDGDGDLNANTSELLFPSSTPGHGKEGS
jgi:hypothetical protein